MTCVDDRCMGRSDRRTDGGRRWTGACGMRQEYWSWNIRDAD